MALIVASIVGVAVSYRASPAPSSYLSTGSLELTDEVAGGIDAVRGRNDALVEIESQILQLESAEFGQLISGALGDDAVELLSLRARSREQSSVITIEAIASNPATAQLAVSAALDEFIEFRVDRQATLLQAELATLNEQRKEQLILIDDLAAELEVARGDGVSDEISILESRTAAALRRLEQYDIAIQEREFVARSSAGQLRIVNVASTAVERPPQVFATGAKYAIMAFVVWLVAAVVVGRLRGRLVLLDEVSDLAGDDIPILATVPKFRRKFSSGSDALVVGRRNARREAEAFRYLRTAIEVATDGRTPVSIAFTSSSSNEGKTVTAANYALAAARAERSVALVDGDLLNPSAASVFAANGDSAFGALLSGRIDPATEPWYEVVTSGEPLHLLVSGSVPASESRQELPTQAVEATIGKLSQIWDVVVVDCPPVLAVSDAMVLARTVDIAVMIVRLGKTTRRELTNSLVQVEQNGVDVAGIVVTHATEKNESYYGYGYGYGADVG